MKKLLLIVLLIVGCEELLQSIKEGCTTATACNYDATATTDDGSCTYAEENYDCEGNCTTTIDCLNVCGGNALADGCGTCDSNSSNDCVQDCAGVYGGANVCGCMDETACNYDSSVTKDDENCVAPQGCNDWCEGNPEGVQECVSIANGTFNPSTLTISTGETVTWTLTNGTHTVVSDDGTWQSGSLSTGGTFTHQFDAAGTFGYKCGIHSGMTGTIIVQ